MGKREEFMIMMHHLYKDGYRDKDLGKYNFEQAWSYFEDIENGGSASPVASITPNGKKILLAMQKLHGTKADMWTAKEIAESYGVTSASVSGGMRKLIADGFAEKGNPGGKTTFYALTPQGLEFSG